MPNFEAIISLFGSVAWAGVAFVVALFVIVAIHEYGHYIVGRWSGIHADVFSIGMGPVLVSRTDRRGTVWQIAAIPFGGYVKFRGDSTAASAPDRAKLQGMQDNELRSTLEGAPLWARAATVAAGPVFNFAFSVLLFAGIFISQGQQSNTLVIDTMPDFPTDYSIRSGDEILAINDQDVFDLRDLYTTGLPPQHQGVVEYRVRRGGAEHVVTGPPPVPALVASVSPGSAAFAAGLQAGDIIVAANDQPVYDFSDVQAIVATTGGNAVAFQIWRAGDYLDFNIAPKPSDLPTADGGFETRWLIGVSSDFFFDTAIETVGFGEAVLASANRVWYIITTTFSGLWHIVTGAISTCNLNGPITIAETSGQVATLGLATFLSFIAAISTIIGLMNLLPVPMLDGGHLMFYLYEGLTRRRPNERVYQVLTSIGVSLVISLMVFALINDIRCP